MMKEIAGNLENATENFIVHPVNYCGVMDKETASLIQKKLITKEMFHAYQNLCGEEGSNLLGTVQLERISDAQYLALLFMENISIERGRIPDYDALDQCLSGIAEHASKENLTIAVPGYLECDCGCWEDIYERICYVANKYSVDITIYYNSEDIIMLLEELLNEEIDQNTKQLKYGWHSFPAGTFREDVFCWFEKTLGIKVKEFLMH